MRYRIQVTEILRRTVEVEANGEDEAIETVEGMCNDDEISLGAEDMDTREFELLNGNDDV